MACLVFMINIKRIVDFLVVKHLSQYNLMYMQLTLYMQLLIFKSLMIRCVLIVIKTILHNRDIDVIISS